MKGFAMDETGDIVVKHNVIQMVSEDELLRQKVKNVIHTNIGEWFLNEYEGIRFHNLLGKGVLEDYVRAEIVSGLKQVDSTFQLAYFVCDIDNSSRKLTVEFKAQNGDGAEVEGEYTWD